MILSLVHHVSQALHAILKFKKLDITLDAVHGLYITDNACPRQQLRGLGASYQHTFGLVGQDMPIEKRSCVNCRPSC